LAFSGITVKPAAEILCAVFSSHATLSILRHFQFQLAVLLTTILHLFPVTVKRRVFVRFRSE